MTARRSIRYGDTTIAYEVRRSERRKKTVQISVTGTGVLVLAPTATPDRDLQAIVRKRAAWILTRSTESTLTAPPKQFVSGETLPYLGRNLRMIVTPTTARTPRVRFDHWRFHVETPQQLTGRDRTDRIRRCFIDWYRARAAQHIPKRVQHWLPHTTTGTQPHTATGTQPTPPPPTQRHPPLVLIRDQHLRWGSCTPDGTLRFNWRVMMLQPALIDYVVLHELTHLVIRNHSHDFWRLLTTAMPDAQTRRRNLREAGRHLPL